MIRFLQFLSFFYPPPPPKGCPAAYLAYLKSLNDQEQGIAAEIVHVVFAGNSVEIPSGLLNGQVTVLYLFCLLCACSVLKFSFSILVSSFHKMLCAIVFVFSYLFEMVQKWKLVLCLDVRSSFPDGSDAIFATLIKPEWDFNVWRRERESILTNYYKN